MLTDRLAGLQDEIMEDMAKDIQKELDAEILRGMLKQMGWYEVVLKPMTAETGDEIDTWIKTNIKGPSHWTHGLVWMFENDQDAMWFKLRWLS